MRIRAKVRILTPGGGVNNTVEPGKKFDLDDKAAAVLIEQGEAEDAATPAPDPKAAIVLEFPRKSAEEVIAAIAELDPVADADLLLQLAELESERSVPRKTVIAALQAKGVPV
jgi:hypothetical protein